MEAHGGYLSRLEDFESAELVRLAREALVEDGGDPSDCSLLASLVPGPRVLRLAYDAPHTYGRRGARWYEHHHALAQALSRRFGLTVHAYLIDPEELEQVVTYGDGRRVGGERIVYEDAELPEDEEGEPDEVAFERLKSRWPIGHLARVLGVSRSELVRIPRAPTLLFNLDGSDAGGRVEDLFHRLLPDARAPSLPPAPPLPGRRRRRAERG